MITTQHCHNSTVAVAVQSSNQTQSLPAVEPVFVLKSMNGTTNPTVAGISMALGIVSNIIALIILANAYISRKKSKATFLLFASSLVATDLAGHVITGAVVLHLYTNPFKQPDTICHFLGGSMVFFGLCPLLLGCVMAIERCMGVTRPLLHKSMVCTTHTRMVLLATWLLALSIALLPVFKLGSYSYQEPGTWCFINVQNKCTSDKTFVVLFSGLGLASLAVAFICNTYSVMTLVCARRRRNVCNRRSSKSHDIEMVAQLVGIMVTSSICWSPLLVFALMSVFSVNSYSSLMVMGVRLASWNQILDPWVYILLRRAVLYKIYQLTTGRSDYMGSQWMSSRRSSFQNSRTGSLHNSKRMQINPNG